MEWFRFYSETVADKKLRHVSRLARINHLQVLGAWTSILCLANDSPLRGKLMLTETLPLTSEDVSETFHVTTDETEALLQAFASANMLEYVEGSWAVLNWDKRQFTSDNVTERVRKHRETKQTETVTERFSNVSETPQIQIQSTDTDCSTPPTPSLPQKPGPEKSKKNALTLYGEALKRCKKHLDEVGQQRLAVWVEEHGEEVTREVLLEAITVDTPPSSLTGWINSRLASKREGAKMTAVQLSAMGLKPFSYEKSIYYLDQSSYNHISTVNNWDVKEHELSRYAEQFPERVLGGNGA